jgi:hypothetical protein
MIARRGFWKGIAAGLAAVVFGPRVVGGSGREKRADERKRYPLMEVKPDEQVCDACRLPRASFRECTYNATVIRWIAPGFVLVKLTTGPVRVARYFRARIFQRGIKLVLEANADAGLFVREIDVVCSRRISRLRPAK